MRERLADGFASAPSTDTLDRGAALIPAPSVASKDAPGTPLGLGGWKDTAAGRDLGSPRSRPQQDFKVFIFLFGLCFSAS